MKLALISDTHGLLRPALFEHLEGVDRIFHAGDVGTPHILTALESVAPVTAVWGNTDGFDLRDRLPEVARIRLEGPGAPTAIIQHGHQLGWPTPTALAELHPEAALIVFGHTHRLEIEEVGSVLVVNPGSCGARRTTAPATIVLAQVTAEGIQTEVVEIPGD